MTLAAMPVHIALVDETGSVPQQKLADVAAAVNAQINRDFGPVWHIRADVMAYPKAPPATWAVSILNKLDEPGALGFHTDDHNQPYSQVELTADWSVTVSHEVLEMLADPWGNRLHGARLPQGVEGRFRDFRLGSPRSRVSYLLEVCDPPERTSYEVGGVAVSDFLLPDWYRTNPQPRLAYSHAGGCTTPRQVADGGYVSFAAPSGEWFQVFNSGGRLDVQDIGRFDAGAARVHRSLRAWLDACARMWRSQR